MARKLSDVAAQVIDLARARRDYWDDELPKRHPDYPLIHPSEDSGPPPPQEAQLEELLAGLPEDMIYKLILIMYLGRGDFAAQDLDHNYKQIKETFGKPSYASSQIIDTVPLADYLADGLAALREQGIGVDSLLPAKPVKSRK
jgi:hypothetical protein